ncbi:MAG: mobile mystery protein B [Planctomycetaceae bacterium]|nr:mobile mystery protein B [Planctomycetaceae bacterium]
MALFEPIPGETPIDDVSGLKIRGITTRSELSEFEARNIAKVALKYLAARPSRRTAKFDFDWCLKLHREMFGEVWDWAGKLRTHELSIGVKFYLIQDQLAGLLEDLESWTGFGMDLVEQSTQLHHRAVQIHPFQNGNGRWARMLGNIWLKRNAAPIIVWPEQTIENVSEIRNRYIAAIKSADQLDYDELVALHREFQEGHPTPS